MSNETQATPTVEAQALPETVESQQNLATLFKSRFPCPSKEEAAEAVKNFSMDDIEDMAWLVHTYVVSRHVEVRPEDCVEQIFKFLEVYGWGNFLNPEFSREEQLSRIREVVRVTRHALEKKMEEQFDMELRTLSMLRALWVAGGPA